MRSEHRGDRPPGACVLAEQLLQKCVAVDPRVLSDVAQDRVERSDFERLVSGDGHVVLARSLRGQADVAAGW